MRYSTGSALADGIGKAILGVAQGDAVERRAYNDRMATILEQELTRAKMRESEANLGLIEGQTWNQYATADKTRAETQGVYNSQALMDPGRLMEAVALAQGTTVPTVQGVMDYTRTGQWGEAGPMEDQAMVQAIQQALAGTQLSGYASNPEGAPATTTNIAGAAGQQDAIRYAVEQPDLSARLRAAMTGDGANWNAVAGAPGLTLNEVTGDTRYDSTIGADLAKNLKAGRGGGNNGAIPAGDIQDNFRIPVPGAQPNPLTGETPTQLDTQAWTDFITYATQQGLHTNKADLSVAYANWAQGRNAATQSAAGNMGNLTQQARNALAQAQTAQARKAILERYVQMGGNAADLAGGQ